MPTEAELGAACQRVLEMFVGVCGAPDDLSVADAANQTLRELETLLIAAAG